jgi:hypothetical protein
MEFTSKVWTANTIKIGAYDFPSRLNSYINWESPLTVTNADSIKDGAVRNRTYMNGGGFYYQNNFNPAPTKKPTMAVTAPTPTPKPIDVTTSNVDRYYLVVAQTDRNLPSSSNVKVLYKSANVEDAKAYMMTKFPCGYTSNYPQRMIVEVIDNIVQAECDVCTAFDPNGNRFKKCCNVGPIAGQGQSLANGFNQFWWGREEIYTMVMAAKRYVNSPYGLEGWVNPNPNGPVVPCNEVVPSPAPPPPTQRKLIKNRKGGRVLINNDYHARADLHLDRNLL